VREEDKAGHRRRSIGAARPTRPRRAAVMEVKATRRQPGSGPTRAARCSRSARRRARQGPRHPRLLADPNDISTALYVGDDLTDLDAFAALRELRDEGALATVLLRRRRVRRDATAPGRSPPTSWSTGPPASAPCSRRWPLEPPCASSTSSDPR
jgi:hypothetical protein